MEPVTRDRSRLNLVRIGSDITYSSLKEIGAGIIQSLRGVVNEFTLAHHNTPVVECIDAQLLTMILHEEYGGHTLGITDADLKTNDDDEFYNCIIGGKNPMNDVAVVSTRKLSPAAIDSDKDYELFVGRTLKVALHEVGHNFGLTDHASYRKAPDNTLCPMSRGEFNKFGYRGYIRAIVDGRGLTFCDECTHFLSQMFGYRRPTVRIVADGITGQSAPDDN